MKAGTRLANKNMVACITGSILLSACGGMDPFDGWPDAIAEGVTCGLTNCTESSVLSPGEIATNFIITQNNSGIRIDAGLGKSLNLITVVRLSDSDKLTATVNGQTVPLSDSSNGERVRYSGTVSNISAQPVVSVSLQRGPDSYPASVTLPAGFDIIAPAGTVNLGRSAGKLRVQFSRSMSGSFYVSMVANCQRSDGTGFTDNTDINPKQDPDAYRIDTADLDAILNERSKARNNNNPNTALVTRCGIDLIWTNSVKGNVSSKLNKYSEIRGLRTVSQRIEYDARG